MSTIVHSELIRELPSTTDFEVVEILLNPGIETTFPWLATQAGSWEFYRFKRLQISYEPLLATTHDGLMAMAIEYSVGSTPPPDLKTLMAYQGACSAPVWQKCKMNLDVKSGFPNGGFKYVRHNIDPDDPKLYDCGALMIAIRKPEASTSAALLRVDYTVEFKTPQVEKPLALADGILSAVRDSDTKILDYTTINAASGEGYVHLPLFVDQNTLGVTVETFADGGKGYVLQPGTYYVNCSANIRTDIAEAVPSDAMYTLKLGVSAPEAAAFTYPDELTKTLLASFTNGDSEWLSFVAQGLLYVDQVRTAAATLLYAVDSALSSGTVNLLIGSGIVIRYLGRGRENVRLPAP